MYCAKLESTKLPENLTLINERGFTYALAPDKINSNTIDIYIPSTIKKIGLEAFGGYDSMLDGNKKIDKMYFGSSEIDLVKNTPDNISIASDAFVSTTINSVIIYCSAEDYGLWNSPTVMN